MQIFQCPACAERIYFDNLVCRCGQEVTFDPEAQVMRTDRGQCRNRREIACNWEAEEGGYCRSCAMTRTVPDIGAPDNVGHWARTEAAKRWMLANLARWGWFAQADAGRRPVFRLLSETTASGEANVTMGHADGLITINVSEASDAVRQERRENLGELYRTMLGHMRHEISHFLHVRLMERAGFAEDFRALFGDERADYGAALKRHYNDPSSPGSEYITAYATAHPHEDWAETTAHLLHLVDLLDSAVASGLHMSEPVSSDYDAYHDQADHMIARAVEFAIAVNHVNRAMDLPDVYPFVLRPGVHRKLRFVHEWLSRA